jgi:hypothetical protein
MRSGFSIIKNGRRLGYPFVESLRSLAPLVDELVVAHGDSNDGTREDLEKLVKAVPCELRIIDSPWDPQSQKGGLELSRQTNIALDACQNEVCIYIQGDEVLHEDEHAKFRRDLTLFEKDPDVEALAFQWLHFYGNYNTIIESRKWYRREVRALKKSSGLRSYQDAQGFRIPEGGSPSTSWRKPRTALSTAHFRHYGWVKPPQVMSQKFSETSSLWLGENKLVVHPEHIFRPLYGMKHYTGSHPKVMQERVKAAKGSDPFEGKSLPFHWKHLFFRISDFLESFFDWRPGEFRNYKLKKVYDT